MARIIDPQTELEELFHKNLGSFRKQMERMVNAIIDSNGTELNKAQAALGNLISGSQALSDMLGRRRVLLEMRAAGESPRVRPFVFSSPRGSGIPVAGTRTFAEAMQDLVSREPIFEKNMTAQRVSEVYSQERGFALARATTAPITRRVQSILTTTLEQGLSRRDAKTMIDEALGKYIGGYAETVYRTNMNTAYTAGRFRQLSNPDIQKVAPAIEFQAVLDADVRRGRLRPDQPNDQYAPGKAEDHKILDGIIGATNDPFWQTYAPPNGYNCRCTIVAVMRSEIEDLIGLDGQVRKIIPPAGVTPEIVHPGFRGPRPDIQIYS